MNKDKISIFTLAFFTILTLLLSAYIKDNYLQQISKQGHEGIIRLNEFEDEKIIRVYQSNNGSIMQIVETIGYHNGLIFLVEINESQIKDVKILSENETPDYGGIVENDWFLDRLKLSIKNDLEIVKLSKKKNNEVVAITGATITSQAVVDGINLCIQNYWRIKK